MMIRVNGATTQLSQDVRTVSDLLHHHDLDSQRVIVEHNGVIVDKNVYAETLLQQGDLLELVHFVGGG